MNGGSSPSLGYQTDNAGNLTNVRGNNFPVSSSTDQIATTQSTWSPYQSVSYDNDGNTLALRNLACTYDPFDQLLGIQKSAGTTTTSAALLGSRSAHAAASLAPASTGSVFSYDASGLRVFRDSEIYVYDGDLLTAHYAGGCNGFYIYGPTGLIGELSNQIPWASSPGTGMGTHRGTLTYTFDPNGSTIERVAGNGVWDVPHPLDAYGEALWSYTNQPGTTQAVVDDSNLIFRYKGQYGYLTDTDTDLVYCHHRYYDPQSARWLTRDPAGLEGGVNTYQYCDGNPVSSIDPSGLFSVGQPGDLESFIPVWGSLRASIDDFQNGKIGYGAFNLVMAVSDCFMVKSLATAAIKGGAMFVARAGGRNLLAHGASEIKAGIVTIRMRQLAEKAAETGLTNRQKWAAAARPDMEAAFRGERVDFAMRRAVNRDRICRLMGVTSTPRGQFGPDFRFLNSGHWWDVTTKAAWPAHVKKYDPIFGPLGIHINY